MSVQEASRGRVTSGKFCAGLLVRMWRAAGIALMLTGSLWTAGWIAGWIGAMGRLMARGTLEARGAALGAVRRGAGREAFWIGASAGTGARATLAIKPGTSISSLSATRIATHC